MSYERFIGLRYLTTRGQQTFISIITVISLGGVALGVAALIIVLAVLTGFEETLKEKILGINPHVLILGYGGGIDNPESVMLGALATPGVVAATPFVYGNVMLANDFGQTGVMLRGIDPERAGRVIGVLDRLVAGSLSQITPIDRERLPGILLGDRIAQDLAVMVGDTITVLSTTGTLNPFMPGPSVSPFRVGGIYDSGMDEYDSRLAYVHLEEGKRLFASKGRVAGIELKVEDPYEADAVKEALVHRFRDSDEILAFRTWIAMNASLLAAFKLEKVVYFVVVVLITLVASFNIVSTLIMVVMEKRKDIAILKTMGATASGIRRIFMVEGLVVGIGGTLLGVVSGVVTAVNLPWLADRYEEICTSWTGKTCKILPEGVFYIEKVPSRVNPEEVMLVAGTAIVICLLATILPAWQASRLDPAEALRYE